MNSENDYIITVVKHLYNNNLLYTMLSEKNKVKQIIFEDDKKFDLYDEISFDLQSKDNGTRLKKEGVIENKEYNNIINNIISNYLKKMNNVNLHFENETLEKITENMLPDLHEVAIKIIKNIITGTPIIIRFHNDADGCSGALALYKSIHIFSKEQNISNQPIFWRINKSIAYNIDALYEDKLMINKYKSIEKPLLLIVDFGTSEESEDALRSKRDFDIIMLDHHPIYESFPITSINNYINPWRYKGDSNYTAGFLAGVVAQLISDTNLSALMNASLIGDHSIYSNLNNKHAEKISIVLDYITGKNTNFNIEKTFEYIENEKELDQLFRHSTSLFEEALASALKHIKRYKETNKIQIFVLDFNYVERVEDDFPLPGRFSSKLHDKIEELNGPNLTIVHYGSYISFRMSNILANNINMLKKLEELKNSNKYVYSAGGHNAAASIRVDREHVKSILKEVLELFGIN
ncbi:MAG: DHH family phosphoesterase [Candidatus Micrarchaeia archaeon]